MARDSVQPRFQIFQTHWVISISSIAHSVVAIGYIESQSATDAFLR